MLLHPATVCLMGALVSAVLPMPVEDTRAIADRAAAGGSGSSSGSVRGGSGSGSNGHSSSGSSGGGGGGGRKPKPSSGKPKNPKDEKHKEGGEGGEGSEENPEESSFSEKPESGPNDAEGPSDDGGDDNNNKTSTFISHATTHATSPLPNAIVATATDTPDLVNPPSQANPTPPITFTLPDGSIATGMAYDSPSSSNGQGSNSGSGGGDSVPTTTSSVLSPLASSGRAPGLVGPGTIPLFLGSLLVVML